MSKLINTGLAALVAGTVMSMTYIFSDPIPNEKLVVAQEQVVHPIAVDPDLDIAFVVDDHIEKENTSFILPSKLPALRSTLNQEQQKWAKEGKELFGNVWDHIDKYDLCPRNFNNMTLLEHIARIKNVDHLREVYLGFYSALHKSTPFYCIQAMGPHLTPLTKGLPARERWELFERDVNLLKEIFPGDEVKDIMASLSSKQREDIFKRYCERDIYTIEGICLFGLEHFPQDVINSYSDEKPLLVQYQEKTMRMQDLPGVDLDMYYMDTLPSILGEWHLQTQVPVPALVNHALRVTQCEGEASYYLAQDLVKYTKLYLSKK